MTNLLSSIEFSDLLVYFLNYLEYYFLKQELNHQTFSTTLFASLIVEKWLAQKAVFIGFVNKAKAIGDKLSLNISTFRFLMSDRNHTY